MKTLKKISNSELTQAFLEVKAGQTASFRIITDRFEGRVFKFCYNLTGSYTLAEEITQETFVRAFNKIDSLRSEKALSSWLICIARRIFLDWVKAKPNNNHIQIETIEESLYEEPPMELNNAVMAGLNSLKANEKTAIILVYLLEHSHEGAAEILSIDLDAFKSLIRVARRKFIEFFTEEEIEVTGIFSLDRKKRA